VFALDLSSTPAVWTQLLPAGDLPSRAIFATDLRCSRDQFVILVERPTSRPPRHVGVTWVRSDSDAPDLRDEKTGLDQLRLTWFTPNGSGQRATDSAVPLVRPGTMSHSSPPTRQRVRTRGSRGGGGRFDYRLGVAAPGGEQSRTALGRDSRSGLRLGFRALGPILRGCRRRGVLRFPSRCAASLDLFNVAGGACCIAM